MLIKKTMLELNLGGMVSELVIGGPMFKSWLYIFVSFFGFPINKLKCFNCDS